jgi:hypothetical protein
MQGGQAIDLLDQSIDLGPVAAPPLVVVAWMLHVHRCGDEDGVPGGQMVERLGVHDPDAIEHTFVLRPDSKRYGPDM